ncbi:MAG: hypothetical protein EOM20_05565, partial [Spartobacteria bacterium]|nr:hypothetical protein [Spartobacteria bacterium]
MTYSVLAMPLPLADVLFALRESTMSGKIIVVLLFIGSIFAWSIMVTKVIELRRAVRSSEGFMAAFRKDRNPLALFLKRHRFPDSPLYQIYEQC